jgi:hypothetical protein
MRFPRNTRNVVGEVTVRINLLADELLSDDLGAGLAKKIGGKPRRAHLAYHFLYAYREYIYIKV